MLGDRKVCLGDTLIEVKTALHMDVSERKLLICLFPVQTNLYAMGVLDI